MCLSPPASSVPLLVPSAILSFFGGFFCLFSRICPQALHPSFHPPLELSSKLHGGFPTTFCLSPALTAPPPPQLPATSLRGEALPTGKRAAPGRGAGPTRGGSSLPLVAGTARAALTAQVEGVRWPGRGREPRGRRRGPGEGGPAASELPPGALPPPPSVGS